MSPRRRTPEEALSAALGLTTTSAGGCWIWRGLVSRDGYGQFSFEGRTRTAHRLVYELTHGPISPGLDLDHLCHSEDATCRGGRACEHRACVNPAHMEPVTRVANIARRKQRLQTCRFGHPYDEANTYVNPQGYWCCRACGRRRAADYKVRRQLRAAGVSA